MSRKNNIPVALTIAGSDSGGGAGIQADLKTFAALGVHGTCAITCITAQNPRHVLGIQPCDPRIVRQQIEAIFAELPPSAAKTGMLYSEEILRVVIACFQQRKRPPLVVDPVMISTSGARLLKSSAIGLLKRQLLPLAALVTPNLPETEALVGRRLKSIDDLRAAARELFECFGCAALVKGGHLRHSRDAVDIFFDGRRERVLKARFIRGVSTHGTGCTFSAAITAELARGNPLTDAVMSAKEHITRAIRVHQSVGRQTVLNNFGR